MSNINQSETAKTRKFGINPATWIFVFAAFILAVSLFIFPVTHSRYQYFLLYNAPDNALPILLSFPLLGLLAGCIYSKVWRIVVCAIIAISSCGFAFSADGGYYSGDITPSWGAIFLAAGITALIWLAVTPQSKLESYPSPFRDSKERLRWLYIGLALVATLIFFVCDVIHYGNMSDGASGSHMLAIAMLSEGMEGWYIVVLPIFTAATALCTFANIKALKYIMPLLMLVPAIMLAIETDRYVHMSVGFYLYVLFVVLSLWVDMFASPAENKA